MATPMEDLVNGALGTAKAAFPASPKVVDFRIRLGTDWVGDDAVFVWVILDDRTPKSKLHHANFKPIGEQVRVAVTKAIREGTEARVDPMAYVYFRLKSEQDGIDRAGAA